MHVRERPLLRSGDMLFAFAPVAALPWLQGFFAPVASSNIGSADCGREGASAMTLVADVVKENEVKARPHFKGAYTGQAGPDLAEVRPAARLARKHSDVVAPSQRIADRVRDRVVGRRAVVERAVRLHVP